MYFRIFKRSCVGYVLILLCFFIPLVFLGAKWCLDDATLSQLKVDIGLGEEKQEVVIDTDPFKKCAKAAALAVAKKWNPALSYNRQKESMLRIADEIYNETGTFLTTELVTSSPLLRAVPGLDIATKVAIKKNVGFNPIEVSYIREEGSSGSESSRGEQISGENRTVEYVDDSENHLSNYTWRGNALSYRQAYFLEKDSRATLEVPFCDLIPHVVYYRKSSRSNHSTAEECEFDYASMSCGAICDSVYGGVGRGIVSPDPEGVDKISEHYSIRKEADDPKVQVSVMDDKIKVLIDSDIEEERPETVGYAIPAECNVDIILTIPTNAAACNFNNRDVNSPTSETPTVPRDGEDYGSASFKSMKKTPIYQIAQAYRKFLRENFEYTRGVNVGLIPYSGKISLPPDVAENWTEPFDTFSWDYSAKPYIRPAVLYGVTPPNYSWPDSNGNVPGWGDAGDYGYFPVGGHGIMCRSVATESCGGGKIYMGDILSTSDPRTHKYKRMNFCPARAKNVNILAGQFSADPEFSADSEQNKYPNRGSLLQGANPYFIVELNPDVTKIHDLLNAVVPFEDERNVSNFLFIPITWANNLLQDWARHDTFAASDTADGGRLSHPRSGGGGDRKKALILVVNKPDWFEPNELTYLGFDNDYSEVPMIESDRIDFSVNYGDTSKKFADGTAYNGTIQGQNKILKFFSSNAHYNSSETGGGALRVHLWPGYT